MPSHHGFDRDADAAAAEALIASMAKPPAESTRRKSNVATAAEEEDAAEPLDDNDNCAGMAADLFVCSKLVAEFRTSEQKFKGREQVDGEVLWDEETTVDMLLMRHELATKVLGSRNKNKGGMFWTSAMVDSATATNLTAKYWMDSDFCVTDAQVRLSLLPVRTFTCRACMRDQ